MSLVYFKKIDYLKGCVIATVLIGHYLNNYITDVHTGGFANGFVAIFFVLAGNASYYSIKNRSTKKHLTAKLITQFYISRIIRILPLYWLSLIIDIFIFHNNHSLVEFTAIKTVGIFLFISAILHCYFFCFIFYYLLEKNTPHTYAITISVIFIVLNCIFFLGIKQQIISFSQCKAVTSLIYRGLFFSHILLFGLGMALNKFQHQIKPVKTIYLFAVMLMLVLVTRANSDSLYIPYKIASLLFIYGVFAVVLNWVTAESRSSINKIPLFLGKYSLSIYLFHLYFFQILYQNDIIHENSIFSIIIVICLSPILFLVCSIIEKMYSQISASINRLILSF